MVAASAVDAALCGVGEDAGVRGGGSDFFGDVFGRIKGSACGFVADEFDGDEEAEAANVADVGMGGERGEGGTEMFGGGLDAGEEVVRFDVVEDGIAGCGRNGMGLIREAVPKDAGAVRECFSDFS